MNSTPGRVGSGSGPKSDLCPTVRRRSAVLCPGPSTPPASTASTSVSSTSVQPVALPNASTSALGLPYPYIVAGSLLALLALLLLLLLLLLLCRRCRRRKEEPVRFSPKGFVDNLYGNVEVPVVVKDIGEVCSACVFNRPKILFGWATMHLSLCLLANTTEALKMTDHQNCKA